MYRELQEIDCYAPDTLQLNWAVLILVPYSGVVLTCFVMCGCFGNMCTCSYCVLYCFVYVYLFLFVLSVLL
jgi:hypothetical protein